MGVLKSELDNYTVGYFTVLGVKGRFGFKHGNDSCGILLL
jgi:hypothetical protein